MAHKKLFGSVGVFLLVLVAGAVLLNPQIAATCACGFVGARLLGVAMG